MPLASACMKKISDEVGSGIMSDDSVYHHGISGDFHPNDTTIPLPIISVPPFPKSSLNETSQCFSMEMGGPAGGTSMIDSSQSKSAQNFQMGHHYPYQVQGQGQEPKPLPCTPDSDVSCPQGYTGWPYQRTRHEHHSQIIPADVMNAAFNLNGFENLPNGARCVTPSYSSAVQPQMVNHGGMAMSHNTGQPLQSMNFGMTMFNPNNQGGAESLLNSGKLDERFMAVNCGTSRDSKPNTIIPTPKVNVTDNSKRTCLPPINTFNNQLGCRSIVNHGLDMNNASAGFPNSNGVISNFSGTSNHGVLFDSRTPLYLGPSYAFQKPAAGEQNHYLRQGFERCMALPSSPYVGSQIMACDNGQSRVNKQLVSCSIGMVTAQSSSMLLPENSGKLSSPSFATSPLVVATGSTRGQDSSSYHGKTQVVASIQQSNPPLGPHSTPDLGRQNFKGIMTAQPSAIASLKRAASQPTSPTVQDQRRKTLSTHPFAHPSIPTRARAAPSGPNTSQAIPPLVHAVQSLTSQATNSSVPQMYPTSWSKTALSAPNTTQSQRIPPVMQRVPLLPPLARRVSSLQPSSHISSPQNQQLIAQALAHQRLRAPPIIAHIKYKDETPQPIEHKCFLCKRDLSYSPEGPISQPIAPPAAGVLPCGHTFHEYCLEQITPDDQSKDPPCIPCALGE